MGPKQAKAQKLARAQKPQKSNNSLRPTQAYMQRNASILSVLYSKALHVAYILVRPTYQVVNHFQPLSV